MALWLMHGGMRCPTGPWVHTGTSWQPILTWACPCSSPHSTISSILGAWLDQYSEDFRKPPDFACLKQLISYVRHNIPGSDLERRARILLAQFQQQEQSETEAEGGMEVPCSPGCLRLQGERYWLASRVSRASGLTMWLNPFKHCLRLHGDTPGS